MTVLPRHRVGPIVVAGVVLIGFGWIAFEWLTVNEYTPAATLDQQQHECDGVPPPTTIALLPADAEVVGAVVCDLPIGGRENVTLASPDRLVELLRIEDVDANSCTADGRPVPGFVLTLVDGTRIRPAAPDDGCHVREDVREYLFAALS